MRHHPGSSPCPRRPGGGRALELLLFIANHSPRSEAARQRLDRLCERCLGPEDTYRVIDVLQDVSQARRWRVVLTPALVVRAGTRTRRFVGALRDEARITAAIDELRTGEDAP